jgi:hypothetical protein
MRIEQVISKEQAVSIQIRDDENEFSKLTTVSVNVVHGALHIEANIDNKSVVLMTGGKALQRPLDHLKMNSIESELESALKLFREIRKDDEE